MSDVTPLRAAQREADPDVVGELRRLLDAAEAGEVVGFVFVAANPLGNCQIGRYGELDDRDIAMAIHDLADELTRVRLSRRAPIEDD